MIPEMVVANRVRSLLSLRLRLFNLHDLLGRSRTREQEPDCLYFDLLPRRIGFSHGRQGVRSRSQVDVCGQ